MNTLMKMTKITIKPIGRDNFNRMVYKRIDNNDKFVDINDVQAFDRPHKFSGVLHTVSSDGEPCYPVNSFKFIIVK